MPRPEITDRQDEYLEFISEFKLEKDYPPTLDELAAHFKVKVGSVQSVLVPLKTKGLVDWQKGQYRTLKLTAAGQQRLKAIKRRG